VMFPADYFIFDTNNACFIVPYDRNGTQATPVMTF
jgi:hypothetical protein